MAEKRKLPPRAGREPAAKRRVSEAATPQAPKKKAPTLRAPSPPPEPVEAPLPTKIKEGEGIPVVRVRQPVTLSDKEYQSIAESAVLLASLERSKKKWLSDGILVRYYTKPKKTKREQIEKNNPPKESMSKIGPCDIAIGPHRFDAMIYTVKDPAAPQLQYPAQQRPIIHYSHPNNFQRYPSYPSPSNQQGRPPYSPAPPGRPPQGYPGNQLPPPHQQRGPHQTPHAPSPSGQRPPQAQNGQPGQPAKPSPDPVIQMLATRAAADPELKALMRVVASSQASQEQLRAFQAHIDELNAIIKAREQQEQRQQSAAGTPTQAQTAPQPATPASQNKPTPPQSEYPKQGSEAKAPSQEEGSKTQPAAQSETPRKESQQQPASESKAPPAKSPSEGTPQSGAKRQNPVPAQTPSTSQNTTAAVKQEPGTTGSNNAQTTSSTAAQPATSTPSTTPGPANIPASNTGSQQQSPAVRPTQTPGNFQQPAPRPGPPYPPYQQSQHGSQPPLQSHPPQHGSPTPYYRSPGPAPPPARVNYKAVVFEFTSPLTPYGSSTSGHAGSGDRYLLPEHSILEWLPNECTILASFLIVRKVDPNTPFPIETAPDTTTSRGKGKGSSKSKKGDAKGKGKDSAEPPNPNAPNATPQNQGTSSNADGKPNPSLPETPGTPSEPPAPQRDLKEYWQPVTFRIHASSPRILEPLTRVVKPADEVRKYMNEIMDRAERAPDGFPAMRLPREEARDAFESEGTPASATNAAASRSRPSRAAVKVAEEESEVENNVLDLEEEELMDFYGAPLGLPPLRV